MPAQSVRAGGVVDGDEALPLLDGEWFGGVDAEPHALALGVEGVEIDVGDDAQRAVGRGVGEGGEVLVRELAPAAAGGAEGGRGGGEGWGGGHGPAFVIASSSNGLLCGSKLFLESCSAWERDDVVAFNPFI